MGRGLLAFSGCMGQCASTHNLYAMDCPREIRAVWRALLVEERAGGPQVGNDALFVIGLHGSVDTIAVFLQDWEVAKVALSCHTALVMLCQEL